MGKPKRAALGSSLDSIPSLSGSGIQKAHRNWSSRTVAAPQPNLRPVSVGRRKISLIGRRKTSLIHHWAVKIDDTWHEIQGQTVGDKGERNRVCQHQNDSDYESIEFLGYTSISKAEVDEFVREWLEKHPTYALLRENCQLFVREIVYHLCGVTLTTENNQIGSTSMNVGGWLVGIGAAFLLAGALIKNH